MIDTVLVTAALGNQGKLLLPRLSAMGLSVRAADSAPDLARRVAELAGVEPACFDLADRQAVRRAMAGVTTVYHVAPNAHPDEVAIGKAMIAAAVEAGVRHFVYSSVLHPQIGALVQHQRKLAVEEELIGAPIAWSILQPTHYMQTQQCAPAVTEGVFRLTWSLERRQSLIDLADVTEIAAKVIAEGAPHFGATYELSSGDCLTAHEIARVIADVARRPVAPVEVSPVEVIESIFGPDPDRARFAARVRFFETVADWYGGHDFVGNPGVAEWLLGRKPNGVADYVRRAIDGWRAH